MNETDLTLAQQIARLEGTLTTGFEAINQRLDTSNGRLAKHDQIIAELASRESFNAGKSKGIASTYAIVFGIIGVAVAILTIVFK